MASSATEMQGDTGCLLAACQQNNSCSCHKQKEAANSAKLSSRTNHRTGPGEAKAQEISCCLLSLV